MIGATELTLFAQVVDAQSFKGAAAEAGITTALVSKRITKLEQNLGVQLLYRTTRRLSLTEAGQALYQHAKGINQQLQDAIDSVSHLSEGLTGHIRMSVPTISGELLLAEAVTEFCQLNPKVTVDMQLENSLVDLVKDGIDLAIRTAVLSDSSLMARKLIQSNWVVCASPQYLNQYGNPNQPEDLKEHNCLAYTYQTEGARDWRFDHRGTLQSIKIEGSFSSNNAHSLKQSALAGHGIVYIPRCCVHRELQDAQLLAILPEYQPRSLGVYAIYPYTRHLPLKIKELIEHIHQAYQAKAEYFSG